MLFVHLNIFNNKNKKNQHLKVCLLLICKCYCTALMITVCTHGVDDSSSTCKHKLCLFVLLWQWHWQRWWMVYVHKHMPKCRVVLFRPLVSRYQQSCGGYTHCVNKSKWNNTQKVHIRRSFVIRTARLTVTHVGFESWRILLAEDAAVDQKEMQNT